MVRSSVATARLREKTARVASLLEATFGIPRQSDPLPAPLDMLIATILSQNTNDKNSFRAYETLRREFRTWADVARAPVDRVIGAIRTGGMAQQKAPRIQAVLEEVRSRFGRYSLEPLRRKRSLTVIDELTSMSGVGPKTAACVLLFSFGRDIFPVDTHIHRICLRLGLVPGCRTPDETFRRMIGQVPRGKGYSFHTNLIRFGRTVCRSNLPLCGECLLYRFCRYDRKDRSRKRAAPTSAEYQFMLLDNVKVTGDD